MREDVERWVIDVTFEDEAEALRAREAIEKLLFDMGNIGTLRFWSEPAEPTGERDAP